MNRHLLIATLALLFPLAAWPQDLLQCQSKDQVLTQIDALTQGARVEKVMKNGRSLGWRYSGVSRDSLLRARGYANGDILSEVCGVPMEELASLTGGECCAPAGMDIVVMFLKNSGLGYEVRLPPAPVAASPPPTASAQ